MSTLKLTFGELTITLENNDPTALLVDNDNDCIAQLQNERDDLLDKLTMVTQALQASETRITFLHERYNETVQKLAEAEKNLIRQNEKKAIVHGHYRTKVICDDPIDETKKERKHGLIASKVCGKCGKEFTPTSNVQKYCSKDCGVKPRPTKPDEDKPSSDHSRPMNKRGQYIIEPMAQDHFTQPAESPF